MSLEIALGEFGCSFGIVWEYFWNSFGVVLTSVAGTGSVTDAGPEELEERSVAPEAAVAASGSVDGALQWARSSNSSVLGVLLVWMQHWRALRAKCRRHKFNRKTITRFGKPEHKDKCVKWKIQTAINVKTRKRCVRRSS